MQEKRPWIERTLRRMRESEEQFPPARLCDGGELPYLGERLSLAVRVGAVEDPALTCPAAAPRCP